MMPTIDEVMDYLGIDYADEQVTRNVRSALNTAVQVLHGSIGADVEQYLPDDPRVAELVKIYADDLYSDRGVSAKVSGATRQLVNTMEWQLRLELLAAKEAAGGEG